MAAGTGIGYFLSARPLYLAYQARGWTPTACEVISSRVVHGDETSRPDIVYRYEIGGREYTANRYDFLPGSNSDPNVRAVVARHEPGRRFECYVDPGDPSRAVINRTPTGWYYFGFVFFAGFAGLPGVVGVFMLRAARRQRAVEQAPPGALAHGVGTSAGASRFAPPPGADLAGPLVLKAASSPLGKLLTMAFICVFWNGIVGLFTWFEDRAFADGDPGAWIMAVFLLLFQAVGLALLVGVPYQMLALANPRPIVTLSRGTVPLGGSVSFTWELSGAAHRVKELKMTLRGREEARYRRGTDTTTDTHDFFSETLVNATHATGIARGSGTIRIPSETMHTFIADNNKVIWTLQVDGTIARWPNVDESFDIMVRPL